MSLHHSLQGIPVHINHSQCFSLRLFGETMLHSDLRGVKNIQQLRRQNFCSRWTLLVELSSGPAAQSRHQLWICGALEKHLLTYLLTNIVKANMQKKYKYSNKT